MIFNIKYGTIISIALAFSFLMNSNVNAQLIEVLNIEITTGTEWNAPTKDDIAVNLLITC